MSKPRCRTCGHISSETDLLGPKHHLTIKDSFTCLSSSLIYCISCRRCPAIYIDETGRALRERFGEHLRSINKNAPGFPVAEHFSSNGHTAADALVHGIKLCEGKKQRKRQEMRLNFSLGTCQPGTLNADFQFIWSSRARAEHNFQLLNQKRVSVALNINEHSTDEGHSP